jgi:hypothetical protein
LLSSVTKSALFLGGVWLGGILFERMGSYDIVWWLSVCLEMASAVINLPIIEQPVPKSVTLAATSAHGVVKPLATSRGNRMGIIE